MNVNTSQNDAGVVKGDFKQVNLVRETDSGISSTVCLIPAKFAKEGRKIDIYTSGEWVNWMVLRASPYTFTDPVDPRIKIKSHRRATGDAMPKKGSK